MAHWEQELHREDGDGHDEACEEVFAARGWLRGIANRSQSPMVSWMVKDLFVLEAAARPYFLGLDYDDAERDDVDELWPF